jgi:hypothetical protein
VREVSKLIEVAVNRTLLERTLGGLDEEERQDLVQHAEEEFLRRLAQLQELKQSQAELGERRREVQNELDLLRRDLSRRRAFAEQRGAQAEAAPGAPAASGQGPAPEVGADPSGALLAATLERRLAPLFAERRPGWLTAASLAGEIAVLWKAELEAALEERDRDHDRKSLNLERRIAKLVGSLETAEKVLERLAARKDLEVGLPSLYRSVQGLSPEEPDRARKRELLGLIFQANVALRAGVT